MSMPVRTNVVALRNPPMLLHDTFSVGGGGSPRTPLMRTRSGPRPASVTVSIRAVTSGLA